MLAASANQVIATAPAMADGLQNIGLRDPATGASSTMTNVLTYGAGPSDTIRADSGIESGNSGRRPGAQSGSGAGAGAGWDDAGGRGQRLLHLHARASSLSACGGAASCTILTDDSGQASTRVTVLQAAVINISALLAPASYNTPKSVQATILGTTSPLDISLVSSFAWIAQGATVDLALAARLLSNGVPVAATQVNYQVVKGSGTLSSASPHQRRQRLRQHHAAPRGPGRRRAGERMCRPRQPALPDFLRDCRAAFDAPAGTRGRERSDPSLRASSFKPVTVRVVDSAIAPHPVLGANVTFQVVVSRPATTPPPVSIGGIIIGKNPPPVIVSSSQMSVLSDGLGLATLQPSTGAAQGALVIQGTAAAGSSVLPFHLQSFLPVTPSSPSGSSRPPLDGPLRDERHRAGRLLWQPKSAPAPVTSSADSRQLVAADRI